jgi:hypothetical protein
VLTDGTGSAKYVTSGIGNRPAPKSTLWRRCEVPVKPSPSEREGIERDLGFKDIVISDKLV